MSEIKRPSLRGTQNTSYLGHFAKDKFLQQGHNDSGKGACDTASQPKLDPSKTKAFELGFKGATGSGLTKDEKKKLAEVTSTDSSSEY